MRKDGSDGDQGGGSFKGQARSNETHKSTSDADARLYRKGKTASELRFMGHTLSDNRHGLIASAVVTRADGYAEREAAKVMINDARQALPEAQTIITLGADKGYDAQEFIEACLAMGGQRPGMALRRPRKSGVIRHCHRTGWPLPARQARMIGKSFNPASHQGSQPLFCRKLCIPFIASFPDCCGWTLPANGRQFITGPFGRRQLGWRMLNFMHQTSCLRTLSKHQ